NAQIEAKGLMVKRGTLIDATVVETAAARPDPCDDPAERVDPDAAFLKREGKPGTSYGYKGHVAVDAGSLLVRPAKVTPANVAETVVADELILANSDGGAIYGDKAYDTHARRELLGSLGLQDGIMHRANKHHALTLEQKRRNAALSKIRCRVETVFAVLKQSYGYRRTRYLGLLRNQLQLTLLAICFNLRRMLVLTAHARSLSTECPTTAGTSTPPPRPNQSVSHCPPSRDPALQRHFRNSPRWGEVGARSAPGEGSMTSESPSPPHPNPLPSGERE